MNYNSIQTAAMSKANNNAALVKQNQLLNQPQSSKNQQQKVFIFNGQTPHNGNHGSHTPNSGE